MKIDKQQIINMIRSQVQSGSQDQSRQAEQELPQQLDTDNQQHHQLLQKFGINPQDLIARFTGGGGIPGL